MRTCLVLVSFLIAIHQGKSLDSQAHSSEQSPEKAPSMCRKSHCPFSCATVPALANSFGLCPLSVCAVQATLVGATCGSLGPQYFQQCINEWVVAQQAAASPNGQPGATCASVSPNTQQECINSYILAHFQPTDGLLIGGCAGVSPDNRQSCLNNLVVQKQQELAGHVQPVVGSSCSTVSPASLQACINSFVMQLADSQGDAAAPCSQDNQACINAFVTAMQQHAGVGLGGCAGVAPENKQACINNYVLSLQQLQPHADGTMPVTAGPAQGTVSALTTAASVATTAVQATTASG